MTAIRLTNMTPIITGIIKTRIASKEREITQLLKHQQMLGTKRDHALVERHRITSRVYGDYYNASFFTLDAKQAELSQLKRDFKLCLAKLGNEDRVLFE